KYHQEKAGEVHALVPGDNISIRSMKVTATPAIHSDPTTIGFKIHTSSGVISYTSDTILDESVVEAHTGSRVLIMSVTRPLDSPIPGHLTSGDALDFVNVAKPELAIFTHFGMKFVDGVAEKEALLVERHTGVRTVPAVDGMEVFLGRKIDIKTFQ
ncbi:MAG: MBL fold metallo-hydrolase, partial [Thermoplasmata archaeon]|nr:MBL fold metallo-hydrolase [Thermoplasmata archaeon]